MQKTTVPVTMGGKSFLICFRKMPKTMATRPPMSSAPMMAPMPKLPPIEVSVGT